MKSARQSAILDIIERYDVKTQQEMTERLADLGLKVTQATVSRDIKELRLFKVQVADGSSKYASTEMADMGVSERFRRMFTDSVLSIAHSGQIVVMKTLPGSANVAGEAIDSLKWPEILGTLSGDNTVMVVVKEEEDPAKLVSRFYQMIR